MYCTICYHITLIRYFGLFYYYLIPVLVLLQSRAEKNLKYLTFLQLPNNVHVLLLIWESKVANSLISEAMLTLSHSNYFVSLQICNMKARNSERVTCRQGRMHAKYVGSTGCKSAGQLLYSCICHITSGHVRSHHFIDLPFVNIEGGFAVAKWTLMTILVK